MLHSKIILSGPNRRVKVVLHRLFLILKPMQNLVYYLLSIILILSALKILLLYLGKYCPGTSFTFFIILIIISSKILRLFALTFSFSCRKILLWSLIHICGGKLLSKEQGASFLIHLTNHHHQFQHHLYRHYGNHPNLHDHNFLKKQR